MTNKLGIDLRVLHVGAEGEKRNLDLGGDKVVLIDFHEDQNGEPTGATVTIGAVLEEGSPDATNLDKLAFADLLINLGTIIKSETTQAIFDEEFGPILERLAGSKASDEEGERG